MSDDVYRTPTGRVMTEAEHGYDVPSSAYPMCVGNCGKPVDITSTLSLQEVTGFKKHRSQGGQNHVLFPEETGRWLCGNCAARWKATKKAGTSPDQESLL